MPVMNPEARLRSMVQADADPELSNDEIETLLEDNSIPSDYEFWAPTYAYPVGAYVTPYPGNNHVYIVTGAGTSGAGQPTFSTVPNSVVTDGSVTWREAGVINSVDLNRAAAQGWILKAGKVANRYNVDMDLHQRLERSKLFDQCMAMAKQYSRKTITSIVVAGAYTDLGFPVIGNVNSG